MRKVFVFAGQSNAMGYGDKIQLTPVPSWAQNAALRRPSVVSARSIR